MTQGVPLYVVLLLGSLSLHLVAGVAVAQTDSSGKFQKLYKDYFDTCMKDWDSAAHMTKEEWSRTCRRLANERAKFRVEQGGEVKPKER
jgi:hypothetical protein